MPCLQAMGAVAPVRAVRGLRGAGVVIRGSDPLGREAFGMVDPSGVKRMLAAMKPGDDVVYVCCRCEPECDSPVLCGVRLYGTMELYEVQKVGGQLCCRTDDGEWIVFAPAEIETLDEVSKQLVLEAKARDESGRGSGA